MRVGAGGQLSYAKRERMSSKGHFLSSKFFRKLCFTVDELEKGFFVRV